MRCLERTRVDHLKDNPDFKNLVEWVNNPNNENYNLEFVGDYVQVYKNGEKFLEDVKNTGSEKNNDVKICCTPSTYACYPNQKGDQIELSVFLSNINQYVQNQEDYFKDRTRKRKINSEKEFQYRLAKKLTVQEHANTVSIFPEYSQKNGNKYRVDLVVLDYSNPKEKPHLVLIEVKRGKQSISDDSGIKSHLETLSELRSSPFMGKTLACDSELVLMQKVELGIIPNLDTEIVLKMADIDYARTTILFVLADIKEDDGILKKECEGIDWSQYYGCPIEFAFVNSSDCDFANYKKEGIEEFSKRWKTK